MKVEITEREKVAIEQGLSRRGVSEVVVKIENGKIVVLQVEKKKIVYAPTQRRGNRGPKGQLPSNHR